MLRSENESVTFKNKGQEGSSQESFTSINGNFQTFGDFLFGLSGVGGAKGAPPHLDKGLKMFNREKNRILCAMGEYLAFL